MKVQPHNRELVRRLLQVRAAGGSSRVFLDTAAGIGLLGDDPGAAVRALCERALASVYPGVSFAAAALLTFNAEFCRDPNEGEEQPFLERLAAEQLESELLPQLFDAAPMGVS
jgi:hypothetical protein